MKLLQTYPIKEQQQKPLVLITQILANLLYRKILQRLPRSKLLCWSKNTADFDESEDNTKMLSYSTGLISQNEKDNVNP